MKAISTLVFTTMILTSMASLKMNSLHKLLDAKSGLSFFPGRSSSLFVSAFAPYQVVKRLSSASTSNLKRNGKRDGRSSFLFQKQQKPQEYVKTTGLSSSSSSSTEDLEQYTNKNNIKDQIFSAISANGEVKVTAVTVRNIVNDVMIQQNLNPTPADALARSMTCGLLLSNGMQHEQTFQLTMSCDGPIRSVMSIASGRGEIKGYVGNPGLSDMHISEAIGKGTVQVVKNHPEWPNPYNGITAIEHGDIDRDVGIYLAESEQRSCALAAASRFNGILCVAGGGYIVEQLPNCSAETIAQVEKNLSKIIEQNDDSDESENNNAAVPAGLLLDGKTPFDICSIILEDLDMKPLQQITPQLVCDCSEERMFRAVRLLPKEDVDQILKDQEQIEARCHFCGKVYKMEPDEVAKRFAAATGDPSLDSEFKG